MRFAAGIAAWLLCGAAAAQGMYKCKDAQGKITYSGNECELIGLESAGEVKGRASVAPAFKAPRAGRTPPATAKPPAKPAATASQSPPKEPAEPQRRCFVVKTAKGSVTRCNDTPPDDEPASK